MQGTVLELAAQIVVERRQRVLPVRRRDALDLKLFDLALDLFGIDALIYFVHGADEKIRANLLQLNVILAEELNLIVFEARGNRKDERVVEVIFDRFVEQLLLNLGELLSESDVEVLAVEERDEVVWLRMLVECLQK